MLYLPACDWLTFKYKMVRQKNVCQRENLRVHFIYSLRSSAQAQTKALENHFMNLCYCTHFGTECVCEQGRAAREVHRGHQEQDPDVGRGGRVPVSSYYDIVHIVQYSQYLSGHNSKEIT